MPPAPPPTRLLLDNVMADTKPSTPPDAPHGTYPRRSSRLLIVLGIVFCAWFALLIWMALSYPAR